MKNPITEEGGCRCGRVRFRVTGAPMITMACHCPGCQKMTASAFSVSALHHQTAFTVTQGETVLGGLQGELRHHCCAFCHSWIYTHANLLGEMVNIRSTLLDKPRLDPPFLECWIDTRLPWVQIRARHSFAQFPDPADFPG